MGFLDKLKRNKERDDDDDELDDIDFDEDGDETSSSSSGGGFMGRAKGLLKRGDTQSFDGDDDDDGTDGGNSDDDADDDDADADDADDAEEQPVRRSGIAAALDGNPDDDEPVEEEKTGREAATAGLGLDLGTLFEEEFVFDPTLRDLADSLDNIPAASLAADLRTFLDEIQ